MQYLRKKAFDLLARREHSRLELRRKLSVQDCSEAELDAVLDHLAEEGLQSDERFAEAYVHSRVASGFGPRRISQELRQRGVDESLIAQYVNTLDSKWAQTLERVWQRKYPEQQGADRQEQARQMRFLLQRGFEPEAVRALLQGKQ